jgi:CDP-diacylglycerol--glycerol-3-phosphate 3-phosphatidyltransferase
MGVALVLTLVTGLDYVVRAVRLRRTSARAMRNATARRAAAGQDTGATGQGGGDAGHRTDTAA